MRVRDLVSIIREDYLNDVKAQKYLHSDASLLRKFSEAEKQACSRADLIFDSTTSEFSRITLVSGVSAYNFSSKIISIGDVVYTGKVLEKRSRDGLDRDFPFWRTDAGLTNFDISYCISGRSIQLNRIPADVEAGTYLYLEVYRLPSVSLQDLNQEFEIPEEHQRSLIYWVLHECYKKQDSDIFDQDKSDYYLARFTQEFGRPISAIQRQHNLESTATSQIFPETSRIRRMRVTAENNPNEW